MPEEHKFRKFILPKKLYESVKKESKEWLIECPCGHKRDVWDVGGTRYKARGEPTTKCICPECGENKWHKIRRKTDEEMRTI